MRKPDVRRLSFITLIVLCASGCALQPAAPGAGKTPQAGCCYIYQDYPWGDYPWESDHNHRTNPAQAWDDYRQYFGTDWHGGEGETPTPGDHAGQ